MSVIEAHGLCVAYISASRVAHVSLTLVVPLNGCLSVPVRSLIGRAVSCSGCELGAWILPADPPLNIRRPRRVGPVMMRARPNVKRASFIGIGEPLGLSPGGDFGNDALTLHRSPQRPAMIVAYVCESQGAVGCMWADVIHPAGSF